MISTLNAGMSRPSSLFVFSLLAACAHPVRPVRTAVVTRVARPPIVAAPQHEEIWPAPAPRDPVEQSFDESLYSYVDQVAAALQTSVTVQSRTALIRAQFGRDLYVSDVRVRHEPSGQERTVRLFGQRPATLALTWNFRSMSEGALRGALSAMMFESWLRAQPDLRLFATFRTSGEARLRWRSTSTSTVVCAIETPAHGPVFEGCWAERGPLAPLADDAMEYRYGRREQLRIRYRRQGGGAVTVRIDEAGVHGASVVSEPDWGPLSNLRVTVLSYTTPERVQVTDEIETFECVREAQWRCEGYRSAR